MPVRPLLLLVFVLSLPIHVSAAEDTTSGQWQPETEQNAKLFKSAEKAFKKSLKDMPDPGHADGPPPDGGMGPPGGAGEMHGPPPGGGMGGPPPGGGGPEGRPPGGGPPRPSLIGLIPAELAFAAPADDGLILQRMSHAVVFGRSDSDAVVIVPFGAKADLGNSVQATMLDEAGQLVLQAETSAGLHVTYRYANPPAQPGALQVDIDVDSARLPPSGFNLHRLYRRAQVDVAAPEKATD